MSEQKCAICESEKSLFLVVKLSSERRKYLCVNCGSNIFVLFKGLIGGRMLEGKAEIIEKILKRKINEIWGSRDRKTEKVKKTRPILKLVE